MRTLIFVLSQLSVLTIVIFLKFFEIDFRYFNIWNLWEVDLNGNHSVAIRTLRPGAALFGSNASTGVRYCQNYAILSPAHGFVGPPEGTARWESPVLHTIQLHQEHGAACLLLNAETDGIFRNLTHRNAALQLVRNQKTSAGWNLHRRNFPNSKNTNNCIGVKRPNRAMDPRLQGSACVEHSSDFWKHQHCLFCIWRRQRAKAGRKASPVCPQWNPLAHSSREVGGLRRRRGHGSQCPAPRPPPGQPNYKIPHLLWISTFCFLCHSLWRIGTFQCVQSLNVSVMGSRWVFYDSNFSLTFLAKTVRQE